MQRREKVDNRKYVLTMARISSPCNLPFVMIFFLYFHVNILFFRIRTDEIVPSLVIIHVPNFANWPENTAINSDTIIAGSSNHFIVIFFLSKVIIPNLHAEYCYFNLYSINPFLPRNINRTKIYFFESSRYSTSLSGKTVTVFIG